MQQIKPTVWFLKILGGCVWETPEWKIFNPLNTCCTVSNIHSVLLSFVSGVADATYLDK